MSHRLETRYGLPAKDILNVIERSPRCEQMVKGFVAEYHLENLLKTLLAKGDILGYKLIDVDGEPDFEVTTLDGTRALIECKMFMSNQKKWKVDFQRTRNSKSNPLSRFYRRSDFDVLAACTYNHNGRWDFVYVRTEDLPLDEDAGEDCLKKAVYYEETNPCWFSSLRDALQGRRVQSSNQNIVSSGSLSLDNFVE